MKQAWLTGDHLKAAIINNIHWFEGLLNLTFLPHTNTEGPVSWELRIGTPCPTAEKYFIFPRGYNLSRQNDCNRYGGTTPCQITGERIIREG